MENGLPERLLSLIACPQCGGRLLPDDPRGVSLRCEGCVRSFEVRGGIPVLYPDEVDTAHLAEEEKLADLMEGHVPQGREIFYEQQWEESKREFWDRVAEGLGPGAGRTILNAGCGIDRRFLDMGAGEELIAFDMMPSLLETMRDRHGSRMNVAGVVQALPFRPDSLDCLCCVDLVHHEPSRLQDIAGSFFRVLRPGGSLFLEDINAWGLYQAWKSVLLPRRLHGALRSLYHDLRGSGHRPAEYEFPTSVFRVRRALEKAGFASVEAVPLYSYPNTGRAGYRLYRLLSRYGRVARYHGFHYLLRAVKTVRGT